MTQPEAEGVPSGFKAVPEGLGFSDTLQPSYLRTEGDEVSFGFLAGPAHGNSMGIVHGGVLMTLADLAAACGVNHARGVRAGSPTINLAVDFIAAAKLGKWIQADVTQVSLKRRFAFASGLIHTSDGPVARFNGTFYLPDHDGMWRGEGPRGGVLGVLDQ